MLNDDSDATEVMGMAKMSLAIRQRTGKMEVWDCQYFSTSKSGVLGERGEFK